MVFTSPSTLFGDVQRVQKTETQLKLKVLRVTVKRESGKPTS